MVRNDNSETENIPKKKTEVEVKTEVETKPVEQEEKKETPEGVK